MADELVLHNHLAKVAIKAGQAVAFVVGDTITAPQCQPAAPTVTGLKNQILGISAKDVEAGDAATILELIPGRIVQVRAGGTITAGSPLGIDSNGDFVDATTGTAAAPIIAKAAATAAGDMVCAEIVHTCGIL